MSKPYGGHHEARRAVLVLDGWERELAEGYLEQLLGAAPSPRMVQILAANHRRYLETRAPPAGLTMAALTHVVAELTHRLGA